MKSSPPFMTSDIMISGPFMPRHIAKIKHIHPAKMADSALIGAKHREVEIDLVFGKRGFIELV